MLFIVSLKHFLQLDEVFNIGIRGFIPTKIDLHSDLILVSNLWFVNPAEYH